MASQPIKYASTSIDPSQSAGEIADLVQKYGAARFEMRWGENARLEGIRFAIRDDELGQVPIRLEARNDRVLEILRDAKPYTSRMRRSRAEWEQDTEDQSHRIAWRQLRDFVEQALLAVETELFPLASAFMAHVEVWDEELAETVTMGELIGRRAELGPGDRGLMIGPGGRRP